MDQYDPITTSFLATLATASSAVVAIAFLTFQIKLVADDGALTEEEANDAAMQRLIAVRTLVRVLHSPSIRSGCACVSQPLEDRECHCRARGGCIHRELPGNWSASMAALARARLPMALRAIQAAVTWKVPTHTTLRFSFPSRIRSLVPGSWFPWPDELDLFPPYLDDCFRHC